MKTKYLSATVLSVLAVSLQGLAVQNQPAQNQSEISSEDTPVTFSSRVNLVSVPVIVRDREGRAVGNLTKEDFQLFDKGKPQVITKFSVEKSESGAVTAGPTTAPREAPVRPVTPVPAQPVLPDRYVAYLIDDVHLNSGDLLNTRAALNKHLDESTDPNTRAAIFTTSGRLVTDFTNDLAKLHAAINRIQPWEKEFDPQTDCPPVTYYQADLLTNKLLYFSGTLFSDAQLKAMASSGQADPALALVINEAAACDSVHPIRTARVAVRRALAFGDRDTTFSLSSVMEIVRRMQAMPGSRTIVVASPGFLVNADHRVAEYDVLDYALRMNVAINTIDMRGLYAPPGFSAESQAPAGAFDASYVSDAGTEAFESGDVLAELADGTGGRFFHDDNGLKEGLNEIAARPEYLYVLGFSPQELKPDGSFHGLKVKVRSLPGASLQVRHGYWAPQKAMSEADEAREDIKDAVFSREDITEIPVDLQTEYFKSTDDKAELTVVANVKADGLRFLKANERNNDKVTVVSGVFDSNGNFIKGIQRVITLHLRDESLASVQRSGFVVTETFDVAPGRYVVRLVVRDTEGRTMAARSGGVEIP